MNIMLHELTLYIDPSTGSAMIQFIIAGLAGFGIAVKIFWGSIKLKFEKITGKNKNQSS